MCVCVYTKKCLTIDIKSVLKKRSIAILIMKTSNKIQTIYTFLILVYAQREVTAFQATSPVQTCYRYAKHIADPCLKLNCNYGSECEVTRNARNATCKCVDRCYSYGDSIDSRPVCGNDGVDYDSLCELRRASCQKGANILVKYYGKCGKCRIRERFF